MARFLNRPARVTLCGTKWSLLLEPLEFDFGHPVPHTVPAGKLTDGPSVPGWLNWLTPREKFMLSGFLHDDLRNKWTTGNAATDGMLRDAATSEGRNTGLKPWQCYLIYLGVRIGTHTGFKSAPPKDVVEEAIEEWAKRQKVDVRDVCFDSENCEVKLLP